MFAGIITALGIVPAVTPPGLAVPVTAQSVGVMLAGAVLGARRGAMAVGLFLALVAVGLPLLAGGRGGLGVFATGSSGYLLAWPLAAALIGWLSGRAGAPYRLLSGAVVNVLGGIVVVYAGGVLGLVVLLDLSWWAALTPNVVYLPGDLVKAVVAALVARGVHAAYPGLLSPGRVGERRRARVS